MLDQSGLNINSTNNRDISMSIRKLNSTNDYFSEPKSPVLYNS